MPFSGLLTASLLSTGAGIFGAETAAGTQQQAEADVLKLLKQLTPQELTAISGGVSGANSTLGEQYGTNMGLLAPYTSSGTNALAQLNGLTASGGFRPPSLATAEQYPGYQFQQEQGELALNQSAAAAGGALSGGALKAAEQYGQGLAQTDYSNVYNQALGTYQTNFGNLAQLANLGMGATNTGVQSGNILGSQQAANTYGGGLASAQILGQNFGSTAAAITGSANASAAGTIGATNAVSGGVNNLSNLMLLQSLLKPGGSGSSGSSYV